MLHSIASFYSHFARISRRGRPSASQDAPDTFHDHSKSAPVFFSAFPSTRAGGTSVGTLP